MVELHLDCNQTLHSRILSNYEILKFKIGDFASLAACLNVVVASTWDRDLRAVYLKDDALPGGYKLWDATRGQNPKADPLLAQVYKRVCAAHNQVSIQVNTTSSPTQTPAQTPVTVFQVYFDDGANIPIFDTDVLNEGIDTRYELVKFIYQEANISTTKPIAHAGFSIERVNPHLTPRYVLEKAGYGQHKWADRAYPMIRENYDEVIARLGSTQPTQKQTTAPVQRASSQICYDVYFTDRNRSALFIREIDVIHSHIDSINNIEKHIIAIENLRSFIGEVEAVYRLHPNSPTRKIYDGSRWVQSAALVVTETFNEVMKNQVASPSAMQSAAPTTPSRNPATHAVYRNLYGTSPVQRTEDVQESVSEDQEYFFEFRWKYGPNRTETKTFTCRTSDASVAVHKFKKHVGSLSMVMILNEGVR